jgi:putative heme transporter
MRERQAQWIAPAATAALAFLLTFGVWWQRDLVTDALDEVGSMPGRWLVLVVMLAAVEALCRAGVFRASSFKISWPQAVALNETALAASNGIPAGAAIGAALRYAMGRSFGQTTAETTVSYLAVGEAFAVGRWLPMMLVSMTSVVAYGGGWWDIGVIALCAGAMTMTLIGAIILCTRCWITRTWLWCATRVQRIVGRRIGFVRRWNVSGFLDDMRDVARPLITANAPLLVLWGVAAQLMNGLVLLAALRGVGVGSEITAIEFWKAFFLVKTVSRFVPTPGNVGVVEVGLTAALVSAGAANAPALAGVLIFRAFTLVLPIITGSLTYLTWRRWTRRNAKALLLSVTGPIPHETVAPVPVPV